ncbi:uncharacterized protein LOC115300715 [Suricata suricatta]|uniref:uncharacterized protein LOC115300715 n=1 Tax=Suricata suricatta TaxID=37032 RepID=UPI00115544EF|nr:uncharacterized protein LOC115300715 [Suricata suricatta]
MPVQSVTSSSDTALFSEQSAEDSSVEDKCPPIPGSEGLAVSSRGPRHVTDIEASRSLRVRAAVGADVLPVTHKPPGPWCQQEEGVRAPVPTREAQPLTYFSKGFFFFFLTLLRIIPSCLCLYRLRSHFSSRLSRAAPLRPADYLLPPFAPRPQTRDCISRQAPRPAANEGLRIWRRRRRSETPGGGGALCAAAAAGAGGGGSSDQDGGGDRRRLSTGRCREACEGRVEPRGPCCPGAVASHSLLSLAAAAARRPPHPSTAPGHPISRSLPHLRFTPGLAGRGPPRCRQPWQKRPARGKSSPGISCGLARFRLLPPQPRRLPAPQPYSGPPCLSCDRTDTAGGLEWNKLKNAVLAAECWCMTLEM